MKKALMIVLAVLISVAFVTTVFAQAPAAPAAPAEKAPAPEKPAKAKTTKSMKLTGEVAKIDKEAKTMTVKGPKGEETFDVAGVKNLDKYKEGEKVIVSYREKDGKMVASSVKKPWIKGKKEKKEVKEKTEKPAAPEAK